MKNVFALWWVLFCCATLCAQNQLAYMLDIGDHFMIEQIAHQTIIQDIDGATHEIINNMSGMLQFDVVEKSEDTYTIDFSFKDLNLQMTSSIQGELMNVKAKEVKENDLQSQIFNSLLDTPVQLILAKNGDILEVNGGDSLVTKMVVASKIEDDFSKNMLKNSLEKEFGSQALSNSYKQLTYFYSDSLTAIGDSWQNEYDGKLNAKNTWTLKAINADTTNISGAADVIMKTNAAGTEMNLAGTQTTEITADRNSGFILKMLVKGVSKGSSTMVQMGDQEIPTTIISKITYELIKE